MCIKRITTKSKRRGQKTFASNGFYPDNANQLFNTSNAAESKQNKLEVSRTVQLPLQLVFSGGPKQVKQEVSRTVILPL